MHRLSALVLSLVFVAGCSFHVAGVSVGDGGTVPVGIDDFAVGDQAFVAADLAGLCSNGGPQAGCSADGTMLLVCDGSTPMSQACASGCSNDGTPHCRGLDPGGPATPSDYSAPDLGDIMISGTALFDTDNGSITSDAFNRNGVQGVVSGVGFRTAHQASGPDIGIFSFHSLTIADGALVAFVGNNAASIVAAGQIQIAGTIDVQGSCDPGTSSYAAAGVGGVPTNGSGGNGSGHGGGGGGHHGNNAYGGGGGGGSGDVGGMGTSINNGGNGGNGGGSNDGLAAPDPVIQGGGGGGAGSGINNQPGGRGGSGGGAVQIATNGEIILGSDSIIQGGGCHGNGSMGGGGGGGGAGGSILLEASTFSIQGGAIIAANGAGGAGGGGDGNSGEDGADSTMDATGGVGGGNVVLGAAGGNGGYPTALAGEAADPDSPGLAAGGGGGGAVGNIAIKSLTGMVDTTGAIVSPDLGEMSSTGATPAFVGVANFD